jgi:hypothetical protein
MIALGCAACADQLTSPALGNGSARKVDVSLGGITPIDTVEVTAEVATTDVSGQVSSTRTTFLRLQGLVATPHGEPTAGDPSGSEAQAAKFAANPTFQRMQLPALTFEGRLAGHSKRVGQRTDSVPFPKEPGAILERTGDGDAPVSQLRKIVNGKVAFIVRNEWQPGPTGWDLVSQSTITGDGNAQITLRFVHRNDYRVSLVGLTANTSKSAFARGAISPSFARITGVRPILDPVFHKQDEADDCADNMCVNERGQALSALAWFDGYQVAMMVACFLPPFPINVASCALATYFASLSAADLLRANAAFATCMTKARAKCRCLLGLSAGNGVDASGFGGFSSAWTKARAARGTIGAFDDCDPTGDNPGGGGGGGGGWVVCWRLYTYDEDGNVIDIQFLYCE